MSAPGLKWGGRLHAALLLLRTVFGTKHTNNIKGAYKSDPNTLKRQNRNKLSPLSGERLVVPKLGILQIALVRIRRDLARTRRLLVDSMQAGAAIDVSVVLLVKVQLAAWLPWLTVSRLFVYKDSSGGFPTETVRSYAPPSTNSRKHVTFTWQLSPVAPTSPLRTRVTYVAAVG